MAFQDHIIDVHELVKVYPGGTRAVAGIDFFVRPGEFYGLLGPNGAGKSTTLKILSTLLKKTSGRVVVAGHDVDTSPDAIRRSIGVAMQAVGLDDLATASAFLELQGALYGLSRAEARRRSDELLELVGLSAVAKRKVGTYSGGMRRRLDLVAALVHQPSILFLDEPTTGLDPQSRLALWDHLRRLNDEGVTVILTTQIMEEADRLCERLGIIDRGEIVAEGSPRELKAEIGGDVVTIAVGGDEADHAAQLTRAEALVRGQPGVMDAMRVEGGLAVTVRDGGAAAPDLLRHLHENAVAVTNLSVSSPTLDDVFLKHTGRTIRSEDVTGGDGMNQAMKPWLGVSSSR